VLDSGLYGELDLSKGAGRLGHCMKVLDRVLRAGDGKRVKALQGLVPDINALESEMAALTDSALQAKTG